MSALVLAVLVLVTWLHRAHRRTDPWRDCGYEETLTLKDGRRVVIAYGPIVRGRRTVERIRREAA